MFILFQTRTVLKDMLDKTVSSIKEFIVSYIETYQMCLNTTNPDFMSELVKSAPEVKNYLNKTDDDNNAHGDTDDETNITQLLKLMICGLNDFDETVESSKQVKIHRNLTSCYFTFVRKNVRDFVPKRIQHKMIQLILEDLDKSLLEHVFTPYVTSHSIDEVLVEEEGVVEDRQRAKVLLNAVNKALNNMLDIQCY